MLIMRHTIHSTVISSVLVIAPLQCLIIQIGDITEHTACHEVFFDEAYKSLHLAFVT